jgi:hypothetical protein
MVYLLIRPKVNKIGNIFNNEKERKKLNNPVCKDNIDDVIRQTDNRQPHIFKH